MFLPLRRVAVALLIAGGSSVAPVRAVEVPLSRASFDRAIAEGRSCAKLADAGPYLAAYRDTAGLLGGMIEGVLQHYTSDVSTQMFVSVRLTTPYTQAKVAACDAHLLDGDLDVEALWSRLQAISTVTIWVETDALTQGNTIETRQEMGDTSPLDPRHSAAGPRVERVGLRRGRDKHAVTVQPVGGDGGVVYEFPATALQGKGTFYAIIHTTEPKLDMAVKLKHSVVSLP